MKKKKLDGLSLKKNVISRIGSSAVKGGIIIMVSNGCPSYNDCSAKLECNSKDCIVQTDGCGHTEVSCRSIHVNCE